RLWFVGTIGLFFDRPEFAAYNGCPLYPRKRTLELSRQMSALCQKRTNCVAANTVLCDDFVKRRIGQHHRGIDLAIWDTPIGLQQQIFAGGRDQSETVTLIEADRPDCGFPSADQQTLCAQTP